MATKNDSKGTSKYAEKKNSGRMMYGPGCCAHTVSVSQIEAARVRMRQRERDEAQYKRERYAHDRQVMEDTKESSHG